MPKKGKRSTTQELIDKLRMFHHYEAADRLEHFARLLDGRCEHCGRTDCERMK